MQILPTNTTEQNSPLGAYFLASNASGAAQDDTSSFADMLFAQQEARAAVQNGETHSVQAALELNAVAPQFTPLEQAPYNLTTQNGVTYTQEEISFTKEELQDLERQLLDNGAPPDTLEALGELADQPDGATLGQVLYALGDTRVYENLSDEESQTLKSIASRIDQTGKLYTDMMEARASGDGAKVLSSIMSAMDALPAGQRVTLSKSDAALLAKAAGLSETATKQLLGSFGNADSLMLNKNELQAFLTPAVHDFAKISGNQEKLSAALDEVLGPLLNAARERMEAEKAASELSNRKVEQSKVVIEETVMEKVNKNLDSTRNNAHAASEDVRANMKNELGDAAHTQNNGKDTGKDGKDAKHNFDADANALLADAKNAKSSDKGDGWAQLLTKTDARHVVTTPTLSNNITTPVMSMGMGTLSTQAQNLAMLKAEQNMQHLSQQAAQQVEKALFTAASNGTKRIDLQLHPAELGALTISLTSRNGEISALLRADNNETTQALQTQMEQVRMSLEQQGIKIDKIEVQNQTQNNTAQQDKWDNLQQHNERQEENARRESLERMRNLAKARNDELNSPESVLERKMQLHRETATNAAHSLYIVA